MFDKVARHFYDDTCVVPEKVESMYLFIYLYLCAELNIIYEIISWLFTVQSSIELNTVWDSRHVTYNMTTLSIEGCAIALLFIVILLYFFMPSFTMMMSCP